MKRLLIATAILLAGVAFVMISKTSFLDFVWDHEPELKSRDVQLGRPLKYATWKLPDYVIDRWDELNVSGALSNPAEKTKFDELDLIAFFLDGWDDVHQFEYLEAIPLDVEDISSTGSDHQVLVYMFDWEVEGIVTQIPIILFNTEPMEGWPVECRSVFVYQVMRYVSDPSVLFKYLKVLSSNRDCYSWKNVGSS